MGRSEPGGEKEWELARIATVVIAVGRREGHLMKIKRIKQAKTEQTYLYKSCVKQNTQETTSTRGIFILESRRDLGRLYEMAPVRIGVMFATIHRPDFQISQRSISRHQNSQF